MMLFQVYLQNQHTEQQTSTKSHTFLTLTRDDFEENHTSGPGKNTPIHTQPKPFKAQSVTSSP